MKVSWRAAFKVSRTPIREALHQLEEQSIVINNPRRGMLVWWL